MCFLRRLLGGPRADEPPALEAEPEGGSDEAPEEDERMRDRELLRAEAHRLDDDLIQRQLRYADRAWVPPREGGEQRADDAER